MAESTFDEICERMEIPENLRKHVAAATPTRAKMAVARGLLPVPPKTLLSMQYMLLGDENGEVAGEAERSLLSMPEDRLVPLLDRKTHPKILEFLAYRRADQQRLAESIALSHQINDKTLCFLAESGSSRVCEIVAGNQERLIITPQVRLFLERNDNAGKALTDRVRSFQRLYEIELPELDEVENDVQPATPSGLPTADPEPSVRLGDDQQTGGAAEPAVSTDAAPGAIWSSLPAAEPLATPLAADSAESTGEEQIREFTIPPAPSETYQPPPGLLNPIADLLSDWGIAADPGFIAPPEGSHADTAGPALIPSAPARTTGASTTVDLHGAVELTGTREEVAGAVAIDISGGRSLAATDFTFNFDEDEASFDDDFVDPNYGDDDQARQSLQQKLTSMTMADKIKLAYKGNKSAREILVRDPNKIIGVAVVKSGRISENEVMTIASNRSINEDVIRALTENREYLRKYPVKLALANNPKTPIPTAMGLLNSLHVSDLKKLANNRNVSSAIFSQANKLYKARKSGQK